MPHEYIKHGKSPHARLTRAVAQTLKTLKVSHPPRGVGMGVLLGVLSVFFLSGRFGLGLEWGHSAIAAGLGWLPLLALWWNTFAVAEEGRMKRAVRAFGRRFPKREASRRAEAIEILVGFAQSPAHRQNSEALLLLAELGLAAKVKKPKHQPAPKTPAQSGAQSGSGQSGTKPELAPIEPPPAPAPSHIPFEPETPGKPADSADSGAAGSRRTKKIIPLDPLPNGRSET